MKLQCVSNDNFKKASKKENLFIRKQFNVDFEEIQKSPHEADELTFVISSSSVDRDKDRIDMAGWELDSYRKNPVVLFAHDHKSPPVAQATKIWKHDSKLKAKAKFTSEDLYPFGHMVYRMYKEGFMRATSVGMLPLEYKWVEDDPEREFGIDFLRHDLLEFSTVPVPANPEALMLAHEKGINTVPLKEWAEKVLDNEKKFFGLSRDDVERAWKAASVSSVTYTLPVQKPDPSNYEDQGSWMSVCVPALMDEGREQDQAVAICLDMWRHRTSGESLMKHFITYNDTHLYLFENENIKDIFEKLTSTEGWQESLSGFVKSRIRETCSHDSSRFEKNEHGVDELCNSCDTLMERYGGSSEGISIDPEDEEIDISKEDLIEELKDITNQVLATSLGRLPK